MSPTFRAVRIISLFPIAFGMKDDKVGIAGSSDDCI
jgi:hypothetical protein